MQFQPVITSHHNESFKSILKLHQASERRDRKTFLIEGAHLVEEAIATDWPLESIWFEEAWADSDRTVLSKIALEKKHSNISLQPTTRDLMRKLSTTTSRAPVIGVAIQKEVIGNSSKPTSLGLVVESLQDPGNLGSMIRISAAAGIGQVVLSRDSVSPTNPKVLRASAGQWFRSPPMVTDLSSFLRQQSSISVQILAACAEGDSYWEHDLTRPTLFLLGNEGNGLSPQVRELASGTISVPMAKDVESLNVAITSAVLTYEALRQRRLSSDISRK